jgi:hypothetical protein
LLQEAFDLRFGFEELVLAEELGELGVQADELIL